MAVSFNELINSQKALAEKKRLAETQERITPAQLSSMMLGEGVPSAAGGNKSVEKLIKSDKDLIDGQKKLTTNIEKLTKAISESALGARGKMGTGGRGQELADAQKRDYRSIGERIKDKFMGKGGDRYDPNSLAYKFGSVRGLLNTTGLVKRGSGGFIDNKLAIREDQLKQADVMTKLNPQEKNLAYAGGDEAKVRARYLEQAKKGTQAQHDLQREQDKLDALGASGMSSEEIGRTTGGKRQIGARNAAAANLIDVDPRFKGEKLSALSAGDTSEKEQEAAAVMDKQTEDLGALPTLLTATQAENERKAKTDAEMITLLQGIAANGGGGALGGMMDLAGDLIGGKGGKAGKLAKAGKLGKLAKFGKMAKIGGAITAVGMGAYDAYTGWNEAEGQVQSGEITKDEGDIKKSSAVGKGTGGAAGALAGATYGAAIGSVVPVVGTAVGGLVGGALGYWGGSKAGSAIGEYGAKAWKGLTGGSEKTTTTTSKTQGNMHVEGMGTNNPKYIINGKEVSPEEYERIANMDDEGVARAIGKPVRTAGKVYNQSAENETNRMNSSKKDSGNTLLNAPTMVNKQTNNNLVKPPVRDQDPSIRQYYRSRFAT